MAMVKNMHSRATIRANVLLALCSTFFVFAVLEIGYRIIDPFPTVKLSDVIVTEHGIDTQYDPVLGWSGVPSAKEPHTTRNRRVLISNNSNGFRDLEHVPGGTGDPAMVFLGDSFTWGFEVEWEEMFVNLIRQKMPEFNIFNLAHRGYGTDQAYLTYLDWQKDWDHQYVVLMFSANDVINNNSGFQYEKAKPRYQIIDGSLRLTGVPVEKVSGWTNGGGTTRQPTGRDKIEDFLSFSHALMDIGFRVYTSVRSSSPVPAAGEEDLSVTLALVKALQASVEEAGAELVVFFIPSKIEVAKLSDAPPYQQRVKALFDENGITSFDMAPHMKSGWRRTYYRRGSHLNEYGHAVLADGVHEILLEIVDK